MNIFQRAASFLGFARQKSFEIPDIVGGSEIFNAVNSWGGSWSMGKRLGVYSKSLYVYACVNKIAQKTASIDWELFKIVNLQGDKEQVFTHEVLDLLYRPNPFQTKEEFFQKTIINKKLAGEMFILKIRNNGGKVIELWNLRPDFVRILLDKDSVIKGYEFSTSNGVFLFKPEDIIHDSYPDPLSDFGGVSPLQPAQARIDTEEFATKYQKNFFINNARPDFLLKSDKKLSPDQKEEIKESWDNRHKAGTSQKKVGKGAILEGGLDYQQVSINQKEMDYIESLKMTRDDILVAFGVPKPVVAITDDVNLANAQTGMQIFISETIVPEIKALTNKINEHLVYTDFSDLLFLEFEDPVPENKTEKADIQAKRITAGTMLINEAREEWGDEPIVGGWNLYLPLGVTASGGLPQNVGKNTQPDKRKNVFRGRKTAHLILKQKAKLVKLFMKTLKKEVEDEAKPKKTALIPEEHRKAYGDMVVKSIDKRGETMEKPLNEFMEDQKKRAIKALKLNSKSFVFKTVDDIEGALAQWGKKETKLVAEFSFPFIQEFLVSAGDQALSLVSPAETFDETTERIQKYLKERSREIGRSTTDTTTEKLVRVLSEGIAADEGINELLNRVDTVYEEYPFYRSQMIARTEATSANNLGFVEAYKQSGVANAKEWIATSDSRTRDSHLDLDGDIVSLDSKFANGLSYPGDGTGDPEESINCRCVLGPAFVE